jgi:predicted metal-dependent enzyme (double-stranded beta helix superfamily)
MTSEDNAMTLTHTPAEIVSFCNECTRGLAPLRNNQERIALMQHLLPQLLGRKQLFHTILGNLLEKGIYPDLRYATMFDSEFILYTDPGRLFSLRMFLWDPGAYDPVHDHNSWGVIGPVTGKLEVVNYRRDDDGTQAGRADLVEADRRIILPPDTYFVLPLDEGIHRTGNPTSDAIIQVSIYGEGQTTRHYINGFDIKTGTCYPIYAPKEKKKLLAARALALLGAELHR